MEVLQTQSVQIQNSNEDLSSIPAKFDSQLSTEEMEEMEELLETFAAKYVGRGIWNMFMTLVFNLKFKIPAGYTAMNCITIIHYNFMHYCRDIYCLICRVHAAKYIANHKIIERLFDISKSDMDEKEKNLLITYEYFVWFYNFRNSANSFAEKTPPELEEVIRHFNGDSSTINPSDFDYENIHYGIWHCIFLLITKCFQLDQIKAVYFIIVNYMKYLPEKQKAIFNEFRKQNDVTELFDDDSIQMEDLCISFFEWAYVLYSEMNGQSGLRVFSENVVRDAYYNISFCTKACGK